MAALVGVALSPPALSLSLDAETAGRFASIALSCVHREYPNHISHLLQSNADAVPPRELYPAFYGCFDWHSSVHGHWLLVRLSKKFPDAPFTAAARKALAKSLTAEKLAGETAYFRAPERRSFERPYGHAWLLQLVAELETWDDPDARAWRNALRPVESAILDSLRDWLLKLSHPIRNGTHSQTAFALGLVLDWSMATGAEEIGALVRERAKALYLSDRNCPLTYEPSGHDFLSPCLAEADLVRRLLPASEFAAWLYDFLPDVPGESIFSWLGSWFSEGRNDDWLTAAVVTDPTDGHLVHLDGLNLSRAWMLDGIASALGEQDPRYAALLTARDTHTASGIAQVNDEHYAGGHWLASFAVYLTTRRGIRAAQ